MATKRAPNSLLFVCTGNTCRSPMAEALARRDWPSSRIQSAGVSVQNPGEGAAIEAIDTMERFGLDISKHRATPLSEIDIEKFSFIAPLEKRIRNHIVQEYNIETFRIRELFVDDPYDSDLGQYYSCANTIVRKLRQMQF